MKSKHNVASCVLLAVAAVMTSCGGGDGLRDYAATGRTADFIPVRDAETWMWGYLSADGKQAIDARFTRAYYFQDGKAQVKDTTGLQGYIDTKGEYMIPARYGSATDFRGGLAWAALPDSGLMVIDGKGNKVFDFPAAAEVSTFIDGYSYFKGEDGLYGIVDTKGQVVSMPVDCEDIIPCGGSLLVLVEKKDYTRRLARLKGLEVEMLLSELKMGIHSADSRFDVIIVKDNGKYGLVDFDGKVVVNPRYDLIAYDSDGMLIFRNDKEKYGWLNSKGEEVIKAKYSDVSDLFSTNGYATVSTSGSKYQIIDRKGEQVYGAKYEKVFPTWTAGVFRMRDKEGKWGLMKADGTVICDPQFEQVVCVREGLFMASSDDRSYGVISDAGLYEGSADYDRPEPGTALSAVAYSLRFTPELVAGMVNELKGKADFGTTFGNLASIYSITKSNMQSYGNDVTLARRSDDRRGVVCELHVMLDNAPLAYTSRWSSRTAINSSAKPLQYYVKVMSDNESKNAAAFNYLKKHLGCEAYDYGADAINKAREFTLHIQSDGKYMLEPCVLYMMEEDGPMDDNDEPGLG